jgi:hypothetical protein
MDNTVYRRRNSNWLSSHATSRQITYWRKQARDIFARYPQVDEIEIIITGRKSESQFISRGQYLPARNQYVVVASTGGKYGRSRRDYPPAS